MSILVFTDTVWQAVEWDMEQHTHTFTKYGRTPGKPWWEGLCTWSWELTHPKVVKDKNVPHPILDCLAYTEWEYAFTDWPEPKKPNGTNLCVPFAAMDEGGRPPLPGLHQTYYEVWYSRNYNIMECLLTPPHEWIYKGVVLSTQSGSTRAVFTWV